MAAPSFIDGLKVTSAAATTITFDMSTVTHTTDDFLLVMVKQSENTGAQVWDDDGGGGNGWTRLGYNRSTGGRDQETAVFYKFATSASESDPTFDWNSGGTTEPMTGLLLVYRNVDEVTPFTELTFQWDINDAHPPNPDVRIDYANTRVVCFHAATHDDISAIGAPTGFTMREYQYGGSFGHTADHRDAYSADIEIDTTGTYSPPDWQHTAGNSTPEYHTYTIALNEVQPIHISAPADNTEHVFGQTGVVIEGDGFETTQGTGKVELWSDLAGTTKVSQTIDTWAADDEITIDLVKGTLADGLRYLVVTNDSGDVSRKVPLLLGWVDYEPWVTEEPDHFWPMDNAYTDEAARDGLARPCNNVQTGTPTFVATPICRTNTHSLQFNQAVESSEIADSVYTNVSNAHESRDIGGWFLAEDLQNTPGIIIEEGGGVNNYYILMNPNGRLVINIADDGDYKAQKYSDFALDVDRAYHILLHSDQPNKIFDLYIDGEKQLASLAGSLGTKDTMVVHSGDWTFGDADANLDTGGVDINYAACYTMLLAQWGTWSNTGGGAPLTATQIKNNLFRKGALAEHTIDAGTEAVMQADIDDYDSQTHADEPLTFEVEDVTGGGDFTLEITDQVWPDEVKFHLRYLGGGTLTIVNLGTSNIDADKCWAPFGTVTVVNRPFLNLTGLKNPTEVRIYDAGTTTEIVGAENVTTGEFSTQIDSVTYPDIDVVLHSLGWQYQKRKNIDMTSGDVALPISQRFDRQYGND